MGHHQKLPEYPHCKRIFTQIELKRFIKTPQGLIKKQHRVSYDDTLFHDDQKYLLFGALIHVGTPSKGKYYSILKCDNYE